MARASFIVVNKREKNVAPVRLAPLIAGVAQLGRAAVSKTASCVGSIPATCA